MRKLAVHTFLTLDGVMDLSRAHRRGQAALANGTAPRGLRLIETRETATGPIFVRYERGGEIDTGTYMSES